VTQQATIIAYANDFKLLMLVALVAMPLVLLVDEVHFLGFRFQCRQTAGPQQPPLTVPSQRPVLKTS
jgi:hypothetical protein